MPVPQHINPLMVKKVSLILVVAMRGEDGNASNPSRAVNYYYDDDGQMVACFDPINGNPDWFRPLAVLEAA